jgi:uncharacterized protein
VTGAVIRVELLSGPNAFLLVVGAVLAPLGLLLVVRRPPARPTARARISEPQLVTLALGVGVVGGIYGIGGGSILAPDWVLGLFLGAGGLFGGYLGASLQPRVPEQALRRVLGILALALGVRYLIVGLG